MDTTVAVHRAASALALVMIALWLLGKDDPEMLAVLAMICADPSLVTVTLLVIALSMAETTPGRRN